MNRDFQEEKKEVKKEEIFCCVSLVQMLSHDLRNQLSNMISASNYYLENETVLTEEQKHSMVMLLHRNSVDLLGQLENIVAVSKIQTAKLKFQAVSMNAILQLTCRKIRAYEKDFRIVLTPSNQDAVVNGDTRLLEQTFILLLQSLFQSIPKNKMIYGEIFEIGKRGIVMLSARCELSEEEKERILHGKRYEISGMILKAHDGSLKICQDSAFFYYEIELPLKG